MSRKYISLAFLAVLITLFSNCKKTDRNGLISNQDYYYWADNTKTYLSLISDEFVAVIPENRLTEIKKLLKEEHIMMEKLSKKDHYLLIAPNKQISEKILTNHNKFVTLNIIPAFHIQNEKITPTNEIIILTNSNARTEEIIQKFNSDILSYTTYENNVTTIIVKHIKNVCFIANKIYETESVVVSRPNFLVETVHY